MPIFPDSPMDLNPVHSIKDPQELMSLLQETMGTTLDGNWGYVATEFRDQAALWTLSYCLNTGYDYCSEELDVVCVDITVSLRYFSGPIPMSAYRKCAEPIHFTSSGPKDYDVLRLTKLLQSLIGCSGAVWVNPANLTASGQIVLAYGLDVLIEDFQHSGNMVRLKYREKRT